MKAGIILILFCIVSLNISAQNESYIIMSYNVENLFDTENDSLTLDDDFISESPRQWTTERYAKKLTDIATVITSIGEWEKPALVGLSEIENKEVLDDLVNDPLLKKLNYKIIHQDSPDERGIDVALLYRPEKFKPEYTEFIAIEAFRTRDILYTCGIIPTGDTLHIFVSHWPSHMGGAVVSEPKRLQVASTLRNKIDSINSTTANPLIVVMGDLNDSPVSKSVREILKADINPDTAITATELYNLYYPIYEKKEIGSYFIRNEWTVLDQMIVSGALLDKSACFYTDVQKAYVFSADFLMNYNENRKTYYPKRTYKGIKYQGGVSDHLPVYVEFIMCKE